MKLYYLCPLVLSLALIFVTPLLSFGAALEISEIAWAGTTINWADEWIEVRNIGPDSVTLLGWNIKWGKTSINLGEAKEDTLEANTEQLPAGEFLILERTDDDALSGIDADIIFSGSLKNTGEKIILENPKGQIVQKVNFKKGWTAGTSGSGEPPYCSAAKLGDKWITCTNKLHLSETKKPVYGTPAAANNLCQNK